MHEDDLTPVANCGQYNFRDTLLAGGRYKPGDCCVVAKNGRQIDRFFSTHPEYAINYIQYSFWDRRNFVLSEIINCQLVLLLRCLTSLGNQTLQFLRI
jgi:hypothetical protein